MRWLLQVSDARVACDARDLSSPGPVLSEDAYQERLLQIRNIQARWEPWRHWFNATLADSLESTLQLPRPANCLRKIRSCRFKVPFETCCHHSSLQQYAHHRVN